jgi:hypothetical protein
VRLRPPRRPGDDTGSLLMAVIVSLVGMSLAALLGPVVLTQINSTRVDIRRVQDLHAAQAGLDAAMAQIRAADDGHGNGVRASLPCGPLTGDVGGGPAGQYRVAVYYVDFDPQQRMANPEAWFAAHDLDCAPGAGPGVLPAFGVFFSTGIGAGSTRMLRAAYRLRTTNQNIAGGRIHIFQIGGSTADLCMDAGATTTPAGGTPLRMEVCDANRKQQVFAYTPDSTLLLVNSVNAAQPAGMCLDAGSPRSEGATVVFQPCESPAVADQQWRYTSSANFDGMNGGGNTTGWTLQMVSADTPGSGVKITKSPTSPGVYNNINSFSPEAAVGPGDAGPQNDQVVNFNQFGRCLDLTGGNYAIGHLIAWPCKPTWNQAFPLPPLTLSAASATPGIISMDVPPDKPTPKGFYCLRSPRSTAPGRYPTMVTCTSGASAPDLQWTVYGYTGNYADSYRILDVDGNCLQPTDPDATPPDLEDNGAEKVSKIVVRPCDESTLQKWNADPNILAGLSLKYVGEN